MKPYLLALCGGEMGFDQPGSIINKGRGVAVAVAKLISGRTVFVTCRHNLFNKVGLVIYDENCKGIQLDKKSLTRLVPKRDDLDLVLFVLPIDVPSERIRLSKQPIERNTTLFHAQNIVTGESKSGDEVFTISEASTSRAGGRAICSLGSGIYEFVADENDTSRAKEAGRQVFYNVLMMESRPGVSGSPLWDKYGAIRGIVCGGNGQDAQVPKLIYLPVRYIESELRVVLKNQK